MKALQACPAEEELAAFLRGEVPADQLDLISKHLDECPTCRSRCEGDSQANAFDDDIKWAAKAGSEVRVDISVPLKQLRETLPEYEIVREIGRGGMGIVFEARHLTLNRSVALKLLPALLGAVREGAVGRFKREAELTARLKHNNIIAVYDFGEAGGSCYYTMELVHGRSLRDILHEIEESGGIDVVVSAAKSGSRGVTRMGSSTQSDRTYFRQVAQWVTEIAEALHYAHGLGVIHRDIKPSNLMLGSDGRMMITDFGLARGQGGKSMTVSRSLIGTARYMCPEQVDSSLGTVDARADIYGLGATLYELLAFHPMFGASDDREVLNDVLNREPTPPHRYVKQVPRELETICLKAVSKDSKGRYQTAQEMADDLRRWLLGMPILAKRPGAVVRAGKFIKRRKLAVTLAAMSLALLMVTAALSMGYSSYRREAETSRATLLAQRLELTLRHAVDKFDAGQFETVLKDVDAGLRDDPESQSLMELSARTLYSLARPREALDAWEKLLTRYPDNAAAHYEAARMLMNPRIRETAEWAWSPDSRMTLTPDERKQRFAFHRDQVARLKPDSPEIFCLLACEEDDHRKAIKLLDRAVKYAPDSADILSYRCMRLQRAGEYQAMLSDADRVLTLRPNWAAAHGRRGRALCDLHRHEEAREELSTSLKIDPQNAWTWCMRAATEYYLGRQAEAIRDANEAIRLRPDMAYALLIRARAYSGLNDYDKAFADMDRAKELEPKNAQVYVESARMKMRAGRIKAAADDITRLLELEPESGSFLRLQRGMVYELGGETEMALADYTMASQQDQGELRDYARIWRCILLQLEHRDDAVRELSRSQSATKPSTPWTELLFTVLTGKAKPAELLSAAKSDDQRAEAHYYIGARELINGNTEEARASFKRCTDLDRQGTLETEFARVRLLKLDRKLAANATN